MSSKFESIRNFKQAENQDIPKRKQWNIPEQKKVDIVEEAYERTLANCEHLLYVACADIFDLLDPVISDSQCHIHSVFIISKLLQAYDKKGIVQYNFKRLSIEDGKLLSQIVLLSLLKYDVKDEVGFTVYSQLIDNLGILTGKVKAEKKFIGNLKATFNARSIEYMKNTATGNIKEIFDGCDATTNRTRIKLQLLPCYVAFYSLLKCMEENNLPIVVTLIRFYGESNEKDSKLKIISKSLLFYEFQKDQKSFVFKHKTLLSDDEKLQPTVAFNCYSIMNQNCPKHFREYMDGSELPSDSFLKEDCDIRDLLMLEAAGHIQLTSTDPMKKGEQIEQSMRELYRQSSNLSKEPRPQPFKGNFGLIEENVFGCYEFHLDISKKFGIAGSRYSCKTRISNQSYATKSTHLVFRRAENSFFALDHVKVSTYSRESEHFKSFFVDSQVPLVEPKNFDNSIAQHYLESMLMKLALHKQ